MSQLSDYLEQNLLDHIYNNVSWTSPTSVWVALHTADPADDASGTEVSGGSYVRVEVNPNSGVSPKWNLAAVDAPGYVVDNLDAIAFPTATASWGTVTHVAIWDASTAGNMLMYGALDSSQTVDNGSDFQFDAGDLNLRLE